jgi:DNA-directed RNA polymerase specialized sigma24 family protein
MQVRKPCHPAGQQIRLAVNGVTPMTASDGRHADAALVQRFRQAPTERERAAVFAVVVALHSEAVLGRCAERLWPDADAAVVAARDVLVAARLAMADPAKLPRPDQLRGWLLGIAVSDGLTPGLPARIDDITWEAVNACAAAGVPEMRDSTAWRASLRHWLEQIAATLPESRQRLFDLFVAKGLDSRDAARELGTSVAEVRRLRREFRQAVLRAFGVTALAAAEAASDPRSDAPGCGELRQILADARRDGDRQEGGRRHTAVLPVALRVTVARHLSQCGTCQGRRDDCTGRWAPELLPMLAGTELNEQVTEDLRAVPELARPRDAPEARRRADGAGTAGTAVARKPAAAAGAGLLAALLLLAFVWPGFVHSTVDFVPRDSAPSSHDPSSTGDRPVTGTSDGVSGQTDGRQVRTGGAGLVNSLPPQAARSLAAPSSPASPTPPVQATAQPSASVPVAHPVSGPSPASSPPALSPSPSAPAEVPSTPPASPASVPPSITPPPSSSSPSPTSPASSMPPSTTPPPSTASPTVPASSAAPSPTLTSSAPSPSSTPTSTAPASSTAPSPTLTPSTPAPG